MGHGRKFLKLRKELDSALKQLWKSLKEIKEKERALPALRSPNTSAKSARAPG
jgi:hypothetical protein